MNVYIIYFSSDESIIKLIFICSPRVNVLPVSVAPPQQSFPPPGDSANSPTAEPPNGGVSVHSHTLHP